MTEEELKQQIISCKKCSISSLVFNDNSQSEKGYGKLFGYKYPDASCILAGLNPSYRRFENMSMCAFCSGTPIEELAKNKKKFGDLFLLILHKLKVLNKCYITNLVKCSTDTNKIDDINMNNCFDIFAAEIELVRPKTVVALGNQVYDYLKTRIKDAKLVKIHHPNYYLSYRRQELKDYFVEIERAFSE
jgi:uracil-DNA glycosylase